jgi:hypothetical protein
VIPAGYVGGGWLVIYCDVVSFVQRDDDGRRDGVGGGGVAERGGVHCGVGGGGGGVFGEGGGREAEREAAAGAEGASADREPAPGERALAPGAVGHGEAVRAHHVPADGRQPARRGLLRRRRAGVHQGAGQGVVRPPHHHRRQNLLQQLPQHRARPQRPPLAPHAQDLHHRALHPQAPRVLPRPPHRRVLPNGPIHLPGLPLRRPHHAHRQARPPRHQQHHPHAPRQKASPLITNPNTPIQHSALLSPITTNIPIILHFSSHNV